MATVETIHQAAKKSFFPRSFILFFLSVWYGRQYISKLLENPVSFLSSTSDLFMGFAFAMLFLVCVVELTGYFIWYSRAKKAAGHGEFVKTYGHSRLQRIMSAAVWAGFAYWIITCVMLGSALQRTIEAALLFYMIALIILSNAIRRILKRKKVPRNINRVVTISASFVLSFCMMGVIIFGVLRASENGFFNSDSVNYKYNGAAFTAYMNELPLTVEDLLDIQYDGYVRKRRSSESLLLGQFVMRQYPEFETEYIPEMPELRYAITEVKLPFIYVFCKESMLNAGKDEQVNGQRVSYVYYEAVDPMPWDAEEAYRLYWSDGYYFERYLLCYERRIVEITFGWEPTAEQMAVAAEKLSGK